MCVTVFAFFTYLLTYLRRWYNLSFSLSLGISAASRRLPALSQRQHDSGTPSYLMLWVSAVCRPPANNARQSAAGIHHWLCNTSWTGP